MKPSYKPTDENIEIIQSYIWTTARHDYNVYEKRIIYRILEVMQGQLSGLKLNQNYSIIKDMFDLYDVELPLDALLLGEEDKNYSRIKVALKRMTTKSFEFEDSKEWRSIPIIMLPRIKKYNSTVSFRLHEEIHRVFMNFSKGFKKYELLTAFNLDSAHAMRLFELLSKQKTPLTYSIIELKKMFGVENKYTFTADFIKRVIEASKKELDEKSPHSFEFSTVKAGKKITAITFYPYEIARNQDKNLQMKILDKSMQPHIYIERNALKYLKENFNMSLPEIKNNVELFIRANKEIPDFLMFLSKIYPKANRAENPKGYLIGAMKKRLKIRTKKEK